MSEPTPNAPIVNAGLLYVNGLQTRYLNSKVITLLPGAARDSTNVADITLSSDIIINGTMIGANGADFSPIVANTFYAVYVIGDSRGYQPTAGLLSFLESSINGPSPIPAGYDMFRRVGWIRTDSSANIVQFYQLGTDESRTYYYTTPINVLVSGSSITFSNVDMQSVVPFIAQQGLEVISQVSLNVTYFPAAAINFSEFHAIDTFPIGIVQFGCGSALAQQGTITVPSQFRQIAYKVFLGDALNLDATGFTDYL